jgi:hypothetical protein
MRERPLASRVTLLLALAAVPLAAFAQTQPTPPPGQPSPIQPPGVVPDAGSPPFPFGHDGGGIRSPSRP